MIGAIMMNPPNRDVRLGIMYVAVLGSTMAITVIGLSAVMLARVERNSVVGTTDSAAARFYAQSAIEIGQQRIRQNSNWRTTYTSGVWEANRAIGTGTYTLEGIDTIDGILSNSPSEPVALRGTGLAGQSRYKLEVTLAAKPKPLTCLQVAMHAGAGLTFSSATVQSNLVTISSNTSATASAAIVYPKVEVVTTASGGTYMSSRKTGITPRTMPDATVFDYYIANGTAIAYSAIPKVAGKTTIEKLVFSPNSNPYGLTNPNGIYVIDCLSGALRIRDSRIVGTLVILNVTTELSIESSVNWEPAIANYPSLLVRGNINLSVASTALSEAGVNTNFNPSGTPYQGIFDTDKVDTYPSVITGLIYASGSITGFATTDGVVVAGTGIAPTSGTWNLTYRSTFYDNPPPGFTGAPEMVISPGTWKQLVN